MKKIFFALVTVAVAVFVFEGCKKEHPLHQTPANYRLQSFEKVSTLNGGLPLRENFMFLYDNINRLSRIILTTNDTSIPNQHITYTYTSDTIYRTSWMVNDTLAFYRDTFVTNYNNQITAAYMPGVYNTFQYYGKLLVQLTDVNGGIMTYTSQDGDFYKSTSTISVDSILSFIFFKNFPNRIGDYLQLNSFALYGQNVYQNTHLVNVIHSSGYDIHVNYVIDADSKITQTNAIVTDSVNDITSVTYNLFYETF